MLVVFCSYSNCALSGGKIMKYKKLLVLVIAVVVVFAMVACGGGGGNTPAKSGGNEATAQQDDGQGILGANIALLVNADSALAINDKGWIQKSWEGIKNYGDANGKTYTWYRPGDNSTQGYLNVISTAVNSGTEIIISLGFQAQEAIKQAQYDYPDTFFIQTDSAGAEADLAPNHYAIFHSIDQAAFLAGIAAVKAGFKDIGITTSLDIPPVNIVCWGYVQGVNYEAGKLGIDGIKLRQTYINSAVPSPEAQTLAASWYTDGVDLIMCNSSGANNSVFAAANAAQKACFGADVDQGGESDMILTCPIKLINLTIVDGISKAYEGDFPGGTFKWYDVDDGGVGLATDHWRFTNYSLDEYAKDLEDFKNDVDGMRSGLIKQDTCPSLESLWDYITDKNITFNIIK